MIKSKLNTHSRQFTLTIDLPLMSEELCNVKQGIKNMITTYN